MRNAALMYMLNKNFRQSSRKQLGLSLGSYYSWLKRNQSICHGPWILYYFCESIKFHILNLVLLSSMLLKWHLSAKRSGLMSVRVCPHRYTHMHLCTCHGRNSAQLWDWRVTLCCFTLLLRTFCYTSVILGLVQRWLITLCQFGEIRHLPVQLPEVPMGAVSVTLRSLNLGIKRFSRAYRAVGLQKPWSEMWCKLLLLVWKEEMNLL